MSPSRRVVRPLAANAGHAAERSNALYTTRYSLATFAPLVLLQQFRRAANIYFLVVAVLQLTTSLSPTGPFSTLLPLLAILSAAAAREAVDDLRRRRADAAANATEVHVLRPAGGLAAPDGAWAAAGPPLAWQVQRCCDLRVGDVVLLVANEAVPADLLLLSCAEEPSGSSGAGGGAGAGAGSAYVDSSGLDGESTLKLRCAPSATQRLGREPARIASGLQRVECECDAPNARINEFSGELRRRAVGAGASGSEEHDADANAAWAGAPFIVTNDNVLLRGMGLRNTAWATGVVIYAGHASKMALNARRPPAKSSRLDRLIDWLVLVVLFVLVLLSAVCAVASRLSALDNIRAAGFYLPFLSTSPVSMGEVFVTSALLLNGLMPISLYVTLEIAQLVQAAAIDSDPAMLHATQSGRVISACTRNSALNSSLGMVSVVVTDKTGTLTRNEMVLRNLFVAGEWFGGTAAPISPSSGGSVCSVQAEPPGAGTSVASSLLVPAQPVASAAAVAPDSAPELFFDSRLQAAISNSADPLHFEATRIALTMALCHSVGVSRGKSGAIEYRGTSPDEVALVQAAAVLGFELVARDERSITLHVRGKRMDQRYLVLAVNAFDASRRRMSVLLRGPDGAAFLLVKGADSSIVPRITSVGAPIAAQRRSSVQGSARGVGSPGSARDGAVTSPRSGLGAQGSRQARRASLVRTYNVIQGALAAAGGALHFEAVSGEVPETGAPALSPPQSDRRDSALTAPGPAPEKISSIPAPEAAPAEGEAGSEIAATGLRPWLAATASPRRMSMISGRAAPKRAPLRRVEFSRLAALQQSLDAFAAAGLRTLVLARRDLSDSDAADLVSLHREASQMSQDRRESSMQLVAQEMETALTLTGATGIEDRLQAGVPEAVSALSRAGMRFVVCTGDKTETALSTAFSCALLVPECDLVMLKSRERATNLASLAAVRASLVERSLWRPGSTNPSLALVIEGHALYGLLSEIDSKAPEIGSVAAAAAAAAAAALTVAKSTTSADSEVKRARRARLSLVRNGADEEGGGVAVESGDSLNRAQKPAATLAGKLCGHLHSAALAAYNVIERLASVLVPEDADDADSGSIAGAASTRGITFALIAARRSATSARSARDTATAAAEASASRAVTTEEARAQLLDFMSQCRVVVCSRMSPQQKSELVRLLQHRDGSISATSLHSRRQVVLAIGDGDNDVNMIQTADVGVGIACATEGGARQAPLSADYAVAQFRHLAPLLLAHGRSNYRRATLAVSYGVYKNAVVGLVLWGFTFWNAFSGTAIFESYLGGMWSLLFTSLPLICAACYEEDIPSWAAIAVPAAYLPGPRNTRFSTSSVALWLGSAALHAFVIGMAGANNLFGMLDGPAGGGRSGGLELDGTALHFVVLVTVSAKLALELFRWHPKLIAAFASSFVLWFAFVGAYSSMFGGLLKTADENDSLVLAAASSVASYYGIAAVLFLRPTFWLVALLVPPAALMTDVVVAYLWRDHAPTTVSVLQEAYHLGGAREAHFSVPSGSLATSDSGNKNVGGDALSGKQPDDVPEASGVGALASPFALSPSDVGATAVRTPGMSFMLSPGGGAEGAVPGWQHSDRRERIRLALSGPDDGPARGSDSDGALSAAALQQQREPDADVAGEDAAPPDTKAQMADEDHEFLQLTLMRLTRQTRAALRRRERRLLQRAAAESGRAGSAAHADGRRSTAAAANAATSPSSRSSNSSSASTSALVPPSDAFDDAPMRTRRISATVRHLFEQASSANVFGAATGVSANNASGMGSVAIVGGRAALDRLESGALIAEHEAPLPLNVTVRTRRVAAASGASAPHLDDFSIGAPLPMSPTRSFLSATQTGPVPSSSSSSATPVPFQRKGSDGLGDVVGLAVGGDRDADGANFDDFDAQLGIDGDAGGELGVTTDSLGRTIDSDDDFGELEGSRGGAPSGGANGQQAPTSIGLVQAVGEPAPIFTRFTHRFLDPARERVFFRTFFVRKSTRLTRIGVGVGVAFLALYLLLSLSTATLPQLIVRSLLVGGGAAFLVVTCLDAFREPGFYSASMLVVVLAAGVAKTLVVDVDGRLGETLFQMAILLVLRLRFTHACAAALIDLSVYVVFTALTQPPSRVAETLPSFVVFVLFCIAFGAIAAWKLQAAMREDFLSEGRLSLEERRGNDMVAAMLPPHVVAALRKAQDERVEQPIKGGPGAAAVPRAGSMLSSLAIRPSGHGADASFSEQEASVTIAFIDILHFKELTAAMSAPMLVALLDRLWALFDALAEKYAVTKLETVGKEYVACAGLHGDRADHAGAIVDFALDVLRQLAMLRTFDGLQAVEVRIGVNSGPVVAGIVGSVRPQYALVGDTTNVASRMSSSGLDNRVNLSSSAYARVRRRFTCEARTINVKSKGLMTVYFVTGREQAVPPPSLSRDVLTGAAAAAEESAGLPEPEAASNPSDVLVRRALDRRALERTRARERAARRQRDVALSPFTYNFRSRDLEARWREALVHSALPGARRAAALLAAFNLFRLADVAVRYNVARVSSSALQRPTDAESAMRLVVSAALVAFYAASFSRWYTSASGTANSVEETSWGSRSQQPQWLRSTAAAVSSFARRNIAALLILSSGLLMVACSMSALAATLDLLFFFSVTSNSQALPLLTASCINAAAFALFVALGQATQTFSPEVTGDPVSGTDTSLYFFVAVGFCMCLLAQAAVEYYRRHRFAVAFLFASEVARNRELLQRMLPTNIVQQLMSGTGEHTAQQFDGVSILFCDVAGFTKLSAVSSPEEIITMLNLMFAGFESAAARNHVFKVQTIGDCFVGVSGIPYVDGDLKASGAVSSVTAEQPALSSRAQPLSPPPTHPQTVRLASPMSPLSFGMRSHAKVMPSPEPFMVDEGSAAVHSGLSPDPAMGSSLAPPGTETAGAKDADALVEATQTPPLPPAWACTGPHAEAALPRVQLNAARMLRTAVEFVHTVRRTRHPRTGQPINVRIGLHCGSVVGGVIGTRAFRYDCWGPDVLLANKYESSGVAGGINVSAAMRDVIVDLQANRAFAIPGLMLHPHEGGDDAPEGGMFLVEIAGFGLATSSGVE